ncbi:MAG: SH3 domain-containing protein [Acidobacteria bacterium]|nr:SH3 domain-containing protein [Acidobacteriota bacterium]
MNHRNLFNLSSALFVILLFSLACVRSGPNQTTSSPASSPAPSASQKQTAGDDGRAASDRDEEKEKLKEKVAELEKKVDSQQQQQQSQRTPPPVRSTDPNESLIEGTPAQVYSPGDGFLALRSEPSSSYGYRIAQMPHGADVDIIQCQNSTERVGGRAGRWCQVYYEGYTGWAFDAWLVY